MEQGTGPQFYELSPRIRERVAEIADRRGLVESGKSMVLVKSGNNPDGLSVPRRFARAMRRLLTGK